MDDHRPVLKSFTGNWRVDTRRSESWEPLFTAMNVGWLARKIVASVAIDSNIYQTNEGIIITDNSVLGTFVMSLVPDGRWRPVLQVDKQTAPVRCTINRETGDLRVETRYPTGRLLDMRTLEDRTHFLHTVTFTPAEVEGRGASTAAPTVVRRYLTRVESSEEGKLAEEAEAAARMMLAHQAATLSLLSGGVSYSRAAPIDHSLSSTTATASSATHVTGELASALTPPPATANKSSSVSVSGAPPTPTLSGTDSGGVVTHSAASGTTPAPAPICDFSGTWILDRTRSDTLDAMLTLMGLPWIARKIANGIEVTATARHDVAGATMTTEDHSSMGITVTSYTFDGQAKQVTAKDGKTSTVTASIVPVPLPPVPGALPQVWAPVEDPFFEGAYGCFRVVSILPEGAGETTDTRVLVEGGRTMKQKLVYSRGSKGETVTVRYLTNKDFDEGRFKASVSAMHPTQHAHVGATATVALAPSSSTDAGTPSGTGIEGSATGASSASTSGAISGASAVIAHATVTTTSGSAGASGSGGGSNSLGASASGGSLDPFFVSLSGVWSADASRSDSLDALWSSLGLGWLARKLIGAFDVTSTITHTKLAFTTDDTSGLGSFSQTVRFNRWCVVKAADGHHYLARAVQTIGGGDKGQRWLGDIGTLPAAWLRYTDSEENGDGSGDGEYDDESDGLSASASEVNLHDISLCPEARGVGVKLQGFPVQAAELIRSEVTVTTVLNDVTAQKDALAALAESHHTGPDPLEPTHAFAVLTTTYRMDTHDEVSVAHVHLDAAQGVVAEARRVLVRRETAGRYRVGQIAESARLEHACALLNARRAAADELKAGYIARWHAKRTQKQARTSFTTSGGGRAAVGTSTRVARVAPAHGAADDSTDDDDYLADGVQCVIA